MTIQRLDETTLAAGLAAICAQDESMARIVAEFGPPPLYHAEPGLPFLVRIVVEQLISLKAADTIYRRLVKAVGELTPENLLTAGHDTIRQAGLTNAKTSTILGLALACASGTLDLKTLHTVSDQAVIKALVALKGIGPWTAKVYLMRALRRQDVWVSGDRALALAVQWVYKLDETPTYAELDKMSERWQPYRSVAVHQLWHYYLSVRV